MSWSSVCRLASLDPDRGAAALVDGHQVALFRLLGTDEVLAVDHRDPFSGANVIARGLVGSRGDAVTVASPVYKQTFDLRTGACLDDESASLGVWETRVVGGVVEVRQP
ncbi:nitrite reductase small subunit NirD [Aeromicrobium sp.]|uniref:nitrite reductase small subunit NirD n=1 Tax=Aeromicrobium sp. TaxID=1871063 RepID=UPI003D6AFF8B